MKINVEIELDWIDEDMAIDDVVKTEIIKNIAKKVENEFTDQLKGGIADSAKKLITAKTEQLIYGLLEKPVTISNGWNDKIEYDSIYDMVEKRMEALYTGKLNSTGKCEKDPLLANIEKYVDNCVSSKIRGVEGLIERHAKKHAADALKRNNLIKSLEAIIPGVDAEVSK